MKLSAHFNQGQLDSLVLEQLISLEVKVAALQVHLIRLEAHLTGREIEAVGEEVQRIVEGVADQVHTRLAARHNLLPEDLTGAKLREDLGLDGQG